MDDDGFSKFNIEDLPDNWFDLIQEESLTLIKRLLQMPSEIGILMLQIVMQNYIYIHLSHEDREPFLKAMEEAFLTQFREWDEEDEER